MDVSPEKSFADPMMLGRQRTAKPFKVEQKTQHIAFNPDAVFNAAHVSTFGDRFRWLEDGWRRLKPSMRDRLIRNLIMLVTTSTFTGMACCEIILYLLVKFINTKLAKPLPFVPTVSCCDTDPHTPVVLSAFEENARPLHVHSNITDRWSSALWTEVQMLKPSAADYIEAKRARMKLVESTIMKHYEQLPSSMMSAPCSFHGGDCCSVVDGNYSRYIGHNVKGLTEIRMNSAGIPCDDITSFGAREGDGGQTAEIHAAWVAERRALNEDIILTECSLGWNADHFTERLADTHNSFTVNVRSGETGDIVDRARKIGVSLNQKTVC